MKIGASNDLLNRLKPTMKVFIQGAAGEPQDVIAAFKAEPDRVDGVEIWSCLVPGMNTFDYGSLAGSARLTTFMASPAIEPSILSGRTRLIAIPYSEIAARLAQTEFDLAILQVAPPDREGACSFGVSCDVGAIVWRRAKQRIAYLNHRIKPPKRSDAMPADAIDLAIPIDAPLLSPAAATKGSMVLEVIGRIAAELIPDGAAIQSGVGEAPRAVVAALISHRNLRIRSGLITPDYRILADAGAFDPAGEHITGIAWGGADFYDWLGESDLAAFRSIETTHGAAGLAATPGFVSINSALEVDLFGQANLEWREGRRISGVGGAPDFLRAAAASAGGRSIIALPSTTRDGVSRIVARIVAPTISIPASDSDVILTEHGAAQLRGQDATARAKALIAIAAPQHRDALSASLQR